MPDLKILCPVHNPGGQLWHELETPNLWGIQAAVSYRPECHIDGVIREAIARYTQTVRDLLSSGI